MPKHGSDVIFENRLFAVDFFRLGLLPKWQEFEGYSPVAIQAFKRCLTDALEGIDSWGKSKANVRTRMVLPLLSFLEWPFVEKRAFKVHGIPMRPDFMLFRDNSLANALMNFNRGAAHDVPCRAKVWELPRGVELFMEVAAANRQLEPFGYIDEERPETLRTPYARLQRFLVHAGIGRGFLCNGRELRLVDLTERCPDMRYLKVNLETLVHKGALEDWQLFVALFSRKAHMALFRHDQEAAVRLQGTSWEHPWAQQEKPGASKPQTRPINS